MAFISLDRAIGVLGIIVTIVLLVLDKSGRLTGNVLLWLLAFAALMTVPLVIAVPWVTAKSGMELFARRALAVSLAAVIYSLIILWIAPKTEASHLDVANREPIPPVNVSAPPQVSAAAAAVTVAAALPHKATDGKPPQAKAKSISVPSQAVPATAPSAAPGAASGVASGPAPSTASSAVPTVTYSERPTFQNVTAVGGDTAILDCDPLATFDRVTAITTSTTKPAIDVGSSECHNQESFDENHAYRKLKSDVAKNAGNRELVMGSIRELKVKLRDLREPEHLSKDDMDKLDKGFAELEKAFDLVADDQQRTLDLLASFRITGR